MRKVGPSRLDTVRMTSPFSTGSCGDETMKPIDTPLPNHKLVYRKERQGLTEEFGTERSGKAPLTSGLSRRAFLQAGAMAITATGLASAGNDSKGDGTLKTTSRSDETGRRKHKAQKI